MFQWIAILVLHGSVAVGVVMAVRENKAREAKETEELSN